jgi:hypothetical protein
MPTPHRSENHLVSTTRIGEIDRDDVVSSLEPLILTQDTKASMAGVQQVAPGNDLRVYVDIVRIRGPISAPGRKIEIFARMIETEVDSGKRAAEIIVDGVPGLEPQRQKQQRQRPSPAKKGEAKVRFLGFNAKDDKPGENGVNGARGDDGTTGSRGGHAGRITVRCGTLASGTSLRLSARGGRGGDGQQGQDGQDGQAGGAGDPGDSGSIGGIGMIDGTSGGKGGIGGDGGDGGAGGVGGDGGEVEFYSTTSSQSSVVIDTGAGAQGTAGSAGAGGKKGEGGKSGPFWIAPPSLWEMAVDMKTRPDGKAGDRDGNRGGSLQQANTAQKGRSTSNPGTGYYSHFTYNTSVPYLRMMLQKVRWHYLSAHPTENPDGSTQAALLLNWVLNLAATASPRTADLEHITAQCRALAGQLASGRSYFGHQWNYAPRLSYAALDDLMHRLSTTLKEIEETSTGYFNEMKSAQAAQRRLVRAEQQGHDLEGQLTRTREGIDTRIRDLLKDIKAADDDVHKQQQAFQSKIIALETALRKDDQLALGDFAKAIAVIAKDPGIKSAAMAAKDMVMEQKAKVEHTAFVVNRIDALGDRVTKVSDITDAVAKNDPNSYLVLASQKRFEEFLKEYKDKLQAEETRDALELLVALSMTRNNLILEYTGLVGREKDLRAQLEQARRQQAETREAIKNNSRPDLPELATFMDDLYQDAKNHFIEHLYQAGRAYTFWSLKEFDVFAALPGLKQPSLLTHAVLEHHRAKIMEAYAQEMEERGAQPQVFPPEGSTDVAGVVVTIDIERYPDAIDQLRTTGETTLHLPAVRKSTSIEDSPFAGKCLVRLTKVRAFVKGATTGDSRFSVRIVHGGTHEFVDPADEPIELTSSSVPRDFSYETKESQGRTINVIYTDGDIGEPKKKGREYGLVSPFTTWRIVLDKSLNRNLDVSKLSAVDLEFRGQFFPFK